MSVIFNHRIISTLVILASFQLPTTLKAETKVAIIDVAFDTRLYLDRIKENGVLVVGRYYSRCPQPELGLRQKRLIDQGLPADSNSEIAQITKEDLAILSIYQYYNNDAQKFSGRTKTGRILRDKNCNWTNIPRTAKSEAELDATAAIEQATAMQQPKGTAIYFGVDFDFSPTDTNTINSMIEYFQVVKTIVNTAGYKVGAYGSGLAHKTLINAKDENGTVGLIDYSWISASRAFAMTSSFHRSGKWHLFQNQVDRDWFSTLRSNGSCKRGLPLDTNIQNPNNGESIGFWKPSGEYTIAAERNEKIYKSRKFACDGNSIIRNSESSGSNDRTKKRQCINGEHLRIKTKIEFANSVKLGKKSSTTNLVQIDADDDGQYDGWTWQGNLTKSYDIKPDWVHSSTIRNNKKCE